jgi:exosortase
MKTLHKRLLIIAVIALAAGFTIYRSPLASVIYSVLHREGSSHGVFVPFLAGYFLWLKSDIIRKIELRYDYAGIVLIIFGVIFPVFNIGAFQIHFLGFIVFIAGLIFTLLGRKFFKEISFPLFFLITMTPIPEVFYETLANYTRHVSFGGSLKIISLLGIPYYKEDWLIQLPNALLHVAISCSGIRYLISYVVFGLAYAWLYRNTTWGRLLIVSLTIPISLVASVLRLTAIFVMTYKIGPYWSQPRPHIFISWIVFFLMLILCIASDQYFQKRRHFRKLAKQY